MVCRLSLTCLSISMNNRSESRKNNNEFKQDALYSLHINDATYLTTSISQQKQSFYSIATDQRRLTWNPIQAGVEKECGIEIILVVVRDTKIIFFLWTGWICGFVFIKILFPWPCRIFSESIVDSRIDLRWFNNKRMQNEWHFRVSCFTWHRGSATRQFKQSCNGMITFMACISWLAVTDRSSVVVANVNFSMASTGTDCLS